MNELHILIVDDDSLLSYALKEHLEQEGYRVTVSNGCEEAKIALKDPSKIDLMILDFLMADGCGTQLFYSMTEDTTMQKPRAILCSGLIEPQNPSWKILHERLPPILQPLIRAYVSKPYTFDQMDSEMNSILVKGPSSESNEIKSGDYLATRRQAPAASPKR